MRINSINITAFGKLKNKRIDFSNGFNLIYGDNEAGKTHIAEFIKLMFYGVGNKGQGLNNTRKKYKPWDDAKMGGSIDFTHDNRRYRLEREFKVSQSSDNVVLHDLDKGTHESISGSEALGERFFGISLSAFEQSVFIDNSVVFSGKSDGGELNLKLANLLNSADEDVSYEKIVKNILSAKEALVSKNSKKGLVPELTAELDELEAEKAKSTAIYAAALEKEKELDRLRIRLEEKKQSKVQIFEKLKQYNGFMLKKQLTTFKAAKEECEQIENKLRLSDNTPIDAAFHESLELRLAALKSKIAITDEKLKEIEHDTELLAEISAGQPNSERLLSELHDKKQRLAGLLENTEKALAENTARLTLLRAKKADVKGKPNSALIIIGALLFVLGAVIGLFYKFLLPFMAVGIILTILGVTLKVKPDFSETDKEIAELEGTIAAKENEKAALRTDIADTEQQINDYIIKSKTDASLLEAKKLEALKKRTDIVAENNELERDRSEIFAAISRFRPVYDVSSAEAALKEMEELLHALSLAKIKAEAAIAHTGCHSDAEALERLAALPDTPEISENRAELDEAFRLLQEECAELDKRITALDSEIKAMTSGVRTPAEFEREEAEKRERLSAMTTFTEEAEIALSTLSDAYSLQRRSWGSKLENRALKIFTGLTGGAYSGFTVSKDFEIAVKGDADIVSHSAEYLSRGTIHQAYFALRLALSEFLCEDSGPLPVILDDVFSQYDAARTKAGLEFLKEYSENNQVIFFTCHKELTENGGADLIEL